MQRLKLFNTNSKSKITQIKVNIRFSNKLASLSDMAEKRSRAVKFAKRIENLKSKINQSFQKQPIEFLNYSNFNPKGDL